MPAAPLDLWRLRNGPPAPRAVSRARALQHFRYAIVSVGLAEIAVLVVVAFALLQAGLVPGDLAPAALHTLAGALVVPAAVVGMTIRAEQTFQSRPPRLLLQWDLRAFLVGSLLLSASLAEGSDRANALLIAGDSLLLAALLAIALWYAASWLTTPEDDAILPGPQSIPT